MCCAQEDCGAPILLTDLRFLLSCEKLEELFTVFVEVSGGTYRFFPSSDCPLVYQVEGQGSTGVPFVCGACFVETCTRCHLKYHPYLSCEKYREFKEDPDSSVRSGARAKILSNTALLAGLRLRSMKGATTWSHGRSGDVAKKGTALGP